MKKQYLGDAVYVESEVSTLRLTIEYGAGATEVIYLDPAVADALLKYIKEWRGEN